MEATETTLDTKLVQLRMAIDRTDAILHSNSEEAIERHQSALKALVIDTDHWKRSLEEQKIASKQDIESINHRRPRLGGRGGGIQDIRKCMGICNDSEK